MKDITITNPETPRFGKLGEISRKILEYELPLPEFLKRKIEEWKKREEERKRQEKEEEKKESNKLVFFEIFIAAAIIINSILVGVQTSYDIPAVDYAQDFLTFVFVVEIFIRFFGAKSTREYFSDGWNIFDISIITLTHIPDIFFFSTESITGVRAIRLLRTFRTLRVLRIFKVFRELYTMIKVLVKSFASVALAGLLLFIFSYIYAIVGVMIFKGHMNIEGIDPFGDLGEAFFSLFRIATGDSWTSFRYDLTYSAKDVPAWLVNAYFISWHIISAFLLLNIVFGAVLSNYEQMYQEEREVKLAEIVRQELEEKEAKEKVTFEDVVLAKLDELSDRLNSLDRK